MIKFITAAFVAAVAALVLSVPASAHHQPDHEAGTPCENGNPTDLCGPDIDVVPATAEECPSGGYVIVVGDSRYVVCNGTDGADGVPGAPGADGQAGSSGTPGTSGASGQRGADGSDGADGSAGFDGAAEACVSSRVAKLRIRYRGRARISRLRVLFEGQRVKVRRVATPDPRPGRPKLREWVARIDLRGKPGGVYSATVRYRKDGLKRSQVHLYRTCFGEAHNGFGLNARPIVRL